MSINRAYHIQVELHRAKSTATSTKPTYKRASGERKRGTSKSVLDCARCGVKGCLGQLELNGQGEQ